MALSPQEALIYVMVVAASADTELTELEFSRIDAQIAGLPVFAGFERTQLAVVANACADLVNNGMDIEAVLDMAIAAIPERLHDTVYVLAVEIATVDLKLQQEELRFLEMVRDRLKLDRLITAAIETTAKARYRHA